jgi:hypothetical protein
MQITIFSMLSLQAPGFAIVWHGQVSLSIPLHRSSLATLAALFWIRLPPYVVVGTKLWPVVSGLWSVVSGQEPVAVYPVQVCRTEYLGGYHKFVLQGFCCVFFHHHVARAHQRGPAGAAQQAVALRPHSCT